MTRPSPFAHRLRLGYVIPAVFWATTLTCGFILRDYDHATGQRVFHPGWSLWFIGLERVFGGTDTAA